MRYVSWEDVEHFKSAEFDSKDRDGSGKGTGENMDPRLIYRLDALRCLIGRRFDIRSGFRTPAHNRAEGGAPASGHLDGLAVDIGTTGWTKAQRNDLILYARKLGFNGIGIASTFVHIDMKARTASWIYRGGKVVGITLGTESKYV